MVEDRNTHDIVDRQSTLDNFSDSSVCSIAVWNLYQPSLLKPTKLKKWILPPINWRPSNWRPTMIKIMMKNYDENLWWRVMMKNYDEIYRVNNWKNFRYYRVKKPKTNKYKRNQRKNNKETKYSPVWMMFYWRPHDNSGIIFSFLGESLWIVRAADGVERMCNVFVCVCVGGYVSGHSLKRSPKFRPGP